jgi:hypothetical protein
LAFIEQRVHEIERKYAHLIRDLLVISLTEQTLRLILVLVDGTTLRVAERWRDNALIRYRGQVFILDRSHKMVR